MELTAKSQKAGLVIAVLLCQDDMLKLGPLRKQSPQIDSLLFAAVSVQYVPGLVKSVMLYDDGTTLPLERR